jgi:hypothetical protein
LLQLGVWYSGPASAYVTWQNCKTLSMTKQSLLLLDCPVCRKLRQQYKQDKAAGKFEPFRPMSTNDNVMQLKQMMFEMVHANVEGRVPSFYSRIMNATQVPVTLDELEHVQEHQLQAALTRADVEKEAWCNHGDLEGQEAGLGEHSDDEEEGGHDAAHQQQQQVPRQQRSRLQRQQQLQPDHTAAATGRFS